MKMFIVDMKSQKGRKPTEFVIKIDLTQQQQKKITMNFIRM